MSDKFFDEDVEPHDPLVSKIQVDKDDTPSKPKATEKSKKAPLQIKGFKVKDLAIAAAAIVVLAVYVTWPDSPPPKQFIADEPPQSVPANDELALPSPVPAVVEPENTPVAEVSLPEVATPVVDTSQLDEIKLSGEANKEAITVLDRRVTELERRLLAAERLLQDLQQRPIASVAAAAAPRTQTKSVAKKRTSQPVVQRTNSRTTAGIKGWKVHTAYTGMAWISHSGSTWAVRPGDDIQGLSIRSIDPARRVVVTDKGTIH